MSIYPEYNWISLNLIYDVDNLVPGRPKLHDFDMPCIENTCGKPSYDKLGKYINSMLTHILLSISTHNLLLSWFEAFLTVISFVKYSCQFDTTYLGHICGRLTASDNGLDHTWNIKPLSGSNTILVFHNFSIFYSRHCNLLW